MPQPQWLQSLEARVEEVPILGGAIRGVRGKGAGNTAEGDRLSESAAQSSAGDRVPTEVQEPTTVQPQRKRRFRLDDALQGDEEALDAALTLALDSPAIAFPEFDDFLKEHPELVKTQEPVNADRLAAFLDEVARPRRSKKERPMSVLEILRAFLPPR